MIGLVFEFVDLLDEARSPGELIPWNPDINQTKYVNARIEKVKSTSDLVKSIARLNVRQKAVIQSVKVGDAIDELFEIRYEVFRALLTVRRSYSSPPKTEEALERLHRADDMMYGTGDQDDEIHVRQQSALSSIQSELAQSLRLGL